MHCASAATFTTIFALGLGTPCSCALIHALWLGAAVSGAAPEEPVVSNKTGHVYEKRLIEKHLAVGCMRMMRLLLWR